MPTTRPDAAPRRGALPGMLLAMLAAAVVMAACTTQPTPSPTSSSSPSAAPPTPSPLPTPVPTPFFGNLPDPGLAALIPREVAGQAVSIPAITEFAVTPGDIGEVYGEIGLRFRTLQLAYVSRPRLSLYAMRMHPPFAATADLEPYLAEAGRYVGISGLHREPWELRDVAGHLVWVRPEDNATLRGTRVYTWAVDGLVFLMIGVDEALNLAMLAGLPGEPPPTPTPVPTASASASPSLEPSASP
ncbi:MAG TPA: hypothetical protein VI733_00020 [Candidatus Limnocylindria bacterium]|nr:hypothetical protein [Candidatus Limnocylindria bacterium]